MKKILENIVLAILFIFGICMTVYISIDSFSTEVYNQTIVKD